VREGEDLQLATPHATFLSEERAADGIAAAVAPPRVSVGAVESVGSSTAFNDLVGYRGFEAKAGDYDFEDLVYAAERGQVGDQSKRRILVELHFRLAHASTPLLFGLVAAFVAVLLPPRGRRLLPFLAAYLPVLLVHTPLWLAGRSLAVSGRLEPWLGMWLPNLVLAAGLLALAIRAHRR
jgi:lipopolysaccharide export LptBFGC system permease protein LptF